MGALDVVSARVRPVSGAESRLLYVPDALRPLLPEDGLRRGATIAVEPLVGGSGLALALAAAVTVTGRWVAAVGMPSLGLVAADESGVDLRRLALVPDPGAQWPVVVAALVDGFDMILLRPPGRVRAAEARRLVARARERGTVLVVLDCPGWAESPDLLFKVGPGQWEGLEDGYGRLVRRRVEVEVGGRRAAGRPRRRPLWLPAADAAVAAVAGAELPDAGAQKPTGSVAAAG